VIRVRPRLRARLIFCPGVGGELVGPLEDAHLNADAAAVQALLGDAGVIAYPGHEEVGERRLALADRAELPGDGHEGRLPAKARKPGGSEGRLVGTAQLPARGYFPRQESLPVIGTRAAYRVGQCRGDLIHECVGRQQ